MNTENLLKGKNVLKDVQKITKEERRRLTDMVKAMDDTEKLITLVTLLKLNNQKEFVDLRILTPTEIEQIDLF